MIPLKCVLINAIKVILMYLVFDKMIQLHIRAENRTSELLLVKYKQTACKASSKMNRYLFISIIPITPYWTIVFIIIYEFGWIKATIYVLNGHSFKSVEGNHNPLFLSSSLKSKFNVGISSQKKLTHWPPFQGYEKCILQNAILVMHYGNHIESQLFWNTLHHVISKVHSV